MTKKELYEIKTYLKTMLPKDTIIPHIDTIISAGEGENIVRFLVTKNAKNYIIGKNVLYVAFTENEYKEKGKRLLDTFIEKIMHTFEEEE